LVGVNLTGFFHITQLAIAEMEKRHSGHVVQITTSLVEHANSNVPSVLASPTKGGLSAATKSLAIEYAKLGIRVNAVAPGVIKTPMHPVRTHAQLAQQHPLGRMGEIADIVGAILYLESAGFVTGETIHVDGGYPAPSLLTGSPCLRGALPSRLTAHGDEAAYEVCPYSRPTHGSIGIETTPV
jgi:NAD(P)-dependent dehydrogenase (short-subunit alcohol dehydrogenase family)